MGYWLRIVCLFVPLVGALQAVGGIAYLWELHESFGRNLWQLLCAVAGVIALLLFAVSVPLVRPLFRFQRGVSTVVVGGVGLASVAQFFLSTECASLRLASAVKPSTEEQALGELSVVVAGLPRANRNAPPLSLVTSSFCEAPPAERAFTLIASFRGRSPRGESQSTCIQGNDWEPVLKQLAAVLESRALGGPIKIDVVSGTQSIDGHLSWLEPLKLRPGLDGVCFAARCLMPWQLLAADVFSHHRPLGFLPDLQWGIEPSRLRAMLGGAALAGLSGLTRLVTRSYIVTEAEDQQTRLLSLRRLRPLSSLTAGRLSKASISRAVQAAERHLVESQLNSGAFRYSLSPFRRKVDTTTLSLPRHAATTLVLCQLGSHSPQVRGAIERALQFLEQHRRRAGNWDVYTAHAADTRAHLGYGALSLLAISVCAERLGGNSSLAAVGRLASAVLALQREDGSFAPWLNLPTRQVGSGPQPLYAAGQAIGALIEVERLQRKHPEAELPAPAVLSRAIDKAMYFVAHRYWQHPLRDYFYLEENWHCLAARAALNVHRNADYERFCLDYVAFKTRLILKMDDGIEPEFVGGFGLGNVIPPHNTATAGLGEAMAAALAIVRARGERNRYLELAISLERLLAFLLKQQWTVDNCFACINRQAVGGISEHPHSSKIRVDYVQHAWAAWGHGARVLKLP